VLYRVGIKERGDLSKIKPHLPTTILSHSYFDNTSESMTLGGQINIVNLTKYDWKLLPKSDAGGYQIDVGDILKTQVIKPGMLYDKVPQSKLDFQS
jgi:hypothetical protein